MGQAKSSGKAPIVEPPSMPSPPSEEVEKIDPINVPMAQNAVIVWLDRTINKNNPGHRSYIRRLFHTVTDTQTFNKEQECIDFVEKSVDKKIYMVISGALGQQVVPRVHHLAQVDSIFIFCFHREQNEDWIKDWSKIRGVYVEIGFICRAIKGEDQPPEQSADPASIVSIDNPLPEKNDTPIEPPAKKSTVGCFSFRCLSGAD